MRQEILRARLGDREEELREYEECKEEKKTTIQDGLQDSGDGRGNIDDGKPEGEDGQGPNIGC